MDLQVRVLYSPPNIILYKIGGEVALKLNVRQKSFIGFYWETRNATEAAKKAGYSEKTAYSIGQRLLKNVEVIN